MLFRYRLKVLNEHTQQMMLMIISLLQRQSQINLMRKKQCQILYFT